MSRFGFENVTILWWGALATLVLLGVFGVSMRRAVRPAQLAVLIALRAAAMVLFVFLLARPFWRESSDEMKRRDHIALLVDRSASMSLVEGTQTRYADTLDFARDLLLPGVRSAKLRVASFLFDEDARQATGQLLAEAVPDGRETNLSRGIIRAIAQADPPPLAVIALTDGASTLDADNARAMSLLVENGIPFVGVGFGTESDSQVLSLDRIVAPHVVSPEQQFRVSVQLRATGATEIPEFSLVLMKDGKFVDEKMVPPTKGPRIWQETFLLTEDLEQFHTYTVRVLPPSDERISCPQTEASATVRILKEQEMRVLFVQGALTWDYKFIRLALAADPTVTFSGLSRTANGSRFFQSVEESGELVSGFPATMEDIAQYRVVILSHLKLTDLTASQQKLLGEFCGDYGGGVLMIGGPGTFNSSWRDSQLEDLLPVRFGVLPGRGSQNRTFRLQPTEVALRHPAFQISDRGAVVDAWNRLPGFTHFAVVESIKPGAQVWLERSDSLQSGQRAPLMVVQRFGSGFSAVVCVQNFWRWRLAQDGNTEHFDRFWRQLIRYLAEGGQETIQVTVPDQELRAGRDIRVLVERQPDASQASRTASLVDVQVLDESSQPLSTQQAELQVGRPVEVVFRAERPGNYNVRVQDKNQVVRANRSVEIRDVSRELERTSRNMETLRQWANLSSGIALRYEECTDADQLLKTIQAQANQVQLRAGQTYPIGINGWMLLALIGCFGSEWILRKRWSLA